jgi:hypothetical protein
MEYRITIKREGGKRQYRTFQLEKSLNNYLDSLKKGPRADLKPIVELEILKRTVGVWYTHVLPPEYQKDEILSHPESMINERKL